jgi:hypothetical protein
MSKANKVTLCGGGCASCPDASFEDDGSVVLSEHGQSVRLSPFALGMLMSEAATRGYLGCPGEGAKDKE